MRPIRWLSSFFERFSTKCALAARRLSERGVRYVQIYHGGSGNASLYVSFGEEPTADAYDSESTRAGNSETVRFTAPQAGTYFIKLTGAYSGLTLVARQ